jgi:hypothetical protein
VDQLGVLLQRIISLKSYSICPAPRLGAVSACQLIERNRAAKCSPRGLAADPWCAGILLTPRTLRKESENPGDSARAHTSSNPFALSDNY